VAAEGKGEEGVRHGHGRGSLELHDRSRTTPQRGDDGGGASRWEVGTGL